MSEPLLSADHSERMLAACGVPLRRLGPMAGFDPQQWDGQLRLPQPFSLPGSTSVAALLALAAAVLEGSRVMLPDVGVNPSRTGCFDALRLLGGRCAWTAKGDRAGHEPVAELRAHASPLRGGAMAGELLLRCGDEAPALCLLGARSARGLQLDPTGCPALAEPSLLRALASLVRAFGAGCALEDGVLHVSPAPRLLPARVDAREDRRLAACAVLFGLAAPGETVVDHAACIDDDYPGLLDLLQRLGAGIEREAPAPSGGQA